jgi:hypothetical protein
MCHSGGLVEAIEEQGCAGSLRELNLSANHRIDAEAVHAIGHMLNRSRLETLHLCGCDVSGKAASSLAAGLAGSQLRRLDLSMNPFGDYGAWGIAWALPDCTGLVHLDLSRCEISNDGADELVESLRDERCTNLAWVDLRGNKIDAAHSIAEDVRVNLAYQRA